MAKGVLDDDEDIEAEIQRQLDALTESDLEEESDEWRLESVTSVDEVTKGERGEDEQVDSEFSRD